MSLHDEPSISQRAARQAEVLRQVIIEAEAELRAEVEHSKKFLLRGDGLRYDFHRSGWPRRRALVVEEDVPARSQQCEARGGREERAKEEGHEEVRARLEQQL